MRTRFRKLRHGRPFWAGLWVLLAGAIIAWLPLGPVTDIVTAGKGAFVGVLIGVLLIAMSALILLIPRQRTFAGVAAIALGLASYPLSNLGGFVAGMMLAIFGGCMALAWAPATAIPTEPLAHTPSQRSKGIEE